MINKKSLILTTLVFLALSGLSAGGGKKSSTDEKEFKITLKLSHVFNPAEQLAISMEEVAAAVTEKTGGAVEIQTFPQAQIAAYKEGVEQVVRGANFISVEDPSFLADYVPDFKALYGPMMYRSFDEYVALTEKEIVEGMKKQAEEQGIKILALHYIYGFRNLITKETITTPEELAGIKIRTPSSKSYIDTLNAMGAVATPLPFGETLSAVQQGVIDGLEGSEFTNLGTKVYETPAKKVAMTRHILGTCGVYISTKVWDSIPEEYRIIMEKEFSDGEDNMVALLKSQHGDVIKELESYGVEFNEVDGDAFKTALEPLYAESDGMTPGIFDTIFGELESMR